MKVLIAEDDRLIRNAMSEVFRGEGHEVFEAMDGKTALELFRLHRPQLVCLDIMMPRVDGYQVCKAIRQMNVRVPIVFVTAKSEEADTVAGLELGADDYLVKPFGVKELMARIHAILRRCRAEETDSARSFTMGDLEVFPDQLRARRAEQVIDLGKRDIQILQLLHERTGEAVDRLTIFQHAWGLDYLPNSRTLDQQISQLRKRIERDPARPQIIRTVHGVGYRYDGGGC